MGAAIQGIRDRVQIMTKVGLRWDIDEGAHFFDTVDPEGFWRITRNLRPDSVRWKEAPLQRLGVDRIDPVQCHWPDPTTPIPDTMGALRDLHEAGTIRQSGCPTSRWRSWRRRSKHWGACPWRPISRATRSSTGRLRRRCCRIAAPTTSVWWCTADGAGILTVSDDGPSSIAMVAGTIPITPKIGGRQAEGRQPRGGRDITLANCIAWVRPRITSAW